jgi:hypothetical protein
MILAKLWKVNGVEVFYNYDYIEANREALYGVLADDSATCLDIYGNPYDNDVAIGDLIEMVDFLPPTNLVDRMYRNQQVGGFITALLREEIHGVENKALYLAELSNAIKVVGIGMLRTGSEYIDLIAGDANLTTEMLERWSSILKSADAVPVDAGQTPISSNAYLGAYLGLSWDGTKLDVTGDGDITGDLDVTQDIFGRATRVTGVINTTGVTGWGLESIANEAGNFCRVIAIDRGGVGVVPLILDGRPTELHHNSVEKLATTETGIDITGDLDVTGSGTFANDKILLDNSLVASTSLPSDYNSTYGHREIGFVRDSGGIFSFIGTYNFGNSFDYNTVYGSRYDHVWMNYQTEGMRLDENGGLDVTGSGTFGDQVSIVSSSFEVLQVERNSAGGSSIEFLNNTGQLGRIGYQADKEFGFISPTNGTILTLSDTGDLGVTGSVTSDSNIYSTKTGSSSSLDTITTTIDGYHSSERLGSLQSDSQSWRNTGIAVVSGRMDMNPRFSSQDHKNSFVITADIKDDFVPSSNVGGQVGFWVKDEGANTMSKVGRVNDDGIFGTELHADNGFTGTGSYTSFTIVDGIITSAS